MAKFLVTASVLVLIFLAHGARADEITKEFHFEYPEVHASAGGVTLKIPGCRTISLPGNPMIPVYSARFVIPPGQTILGIKWEILEQEEFTLSGELSPAPPQLPLNRAHNIRTTIQKKNKAIYNLSTPFPGKHAELIATHQFCGIRIAFINIYPCQYIPALNRVLFSKRIKLTIETSNQAKKPQETYSFIPKESLDRLEREVENPEELAGARALAEPVSEKYSLQQQTIVPYVIITTSSLSSAFDSLAQLRRIQGLNAEIIDLSWIDANFPGNDIQERIREFIRYAYNNWHTRYVLLGGDNEIIPNRPLYAKVGTEIEPDICSDLYYGALDGTWNADGDSYYGEEGEEDLLPEVIVGRLPVDTEEEAKALVSKIYNHSLNPVVDQCKTAFSLGELLWSIDGVDTWGGDYKDEIVNGSDNYGFYTEGIPSSFEISKLYDRDLGFSWNKAQLLPILNGGVNIVNHLGHSNQFYVMRLSNADISSLSNDGVSSSFFILYSQGCFAGSFDNRDYDGVYYSDDCIAEELLTSTHGAVAFVGNTRLGWDAPGSTCGASQFYDRQFFDAIFGEGIKVIGDALEDSRFDNLGYISYPAVRYIFYEMTLLGDPAMHIWTDTPRKLVANYDSTIVGTQNTFEIEVRDDRGAIEGANACLFSTSNEVISFALTDASGKAELDINGDLDGRCILTVCAPDHYPIADTIEVIDSSSPLPSIVSISLDDDTVGVTDGDADGLAEPGEKLSFNIIVRNDGTSECTNTILSISTPDKEYISIIDTSYFIGEIPAGYWLILNDKVSFRLADDTPYGYSATVRLVFSSNEGQWAYPQTLITNSPSPEIENVMISDFLDGNSNGCIEAWEFLTVSLTLRNEGNMDLLYPTITMEFPDSSWGKAIKSKTLLPTLLPGESYEVPEGELEFFVKEKTPEFSTIDFFLKISADNLPTKVETLSIQTCGNNLNDQVDARNTSPLKHHSIIGYDQWHITDSDYHSPPFCWKFGDTADASYYNMSDAVLVTPPVCLDGNSTLRFWHRMEAEAGTTYPYWAEDAGVVEISTDLGETWNIINPINLYPCRASSSNTIFLSPYTRCYSGSFDWTLAEFDLSMYSGPVMLRFRFASNEQYGYEGWLIDDIEVSTEYTTDVEDKTPEAILSFFLGAPYPNPFNPTTTIPFELAKTNMVKIKAYDITGREVKTIVDRVLPAGSYSVVWDGKDNRGKNLASGVYFLRMDCGFYRATRRVVLVR